MRHLGHVAANMHPNAGGGDDSLRWGGTATSRQRRTTSDRRSPPTRVGQLQFSSIQRSSSTSPGHTCQPTTRSAWSPMNFQPGHTSQTIWNRIAEHGDHQKNDPGAIPPLLWRFERPCSNDISQRRQDADVAARRPMVACKFKPNGDSHSGRTPTHRGSESIKRNVRRSSGPRSPRVFALPWAQFTTDVSHLDLNRPRQTSKREFG